MNWRENNNTLHPLMKGLVGLYIFNEGQLALPNCYSKHSFDDYRCIVPCLLAQQCFKAKFCKTASIEQLATYLTDNEPLVREAAKERFDELAGGNK